MASRLVTVCALVLATLGQASLINQRPFTSSMHLYKADGSFPACKDENQFNTTIHISALDPDDPDKTLPVFHRNGRLYAVAGHAATVWTVTRANDYDNKVEYIVTTTHPSGKTLYLGTGTTSNEELDITDYDYGSGRYQFSQTEEYHAESDKPEPRIAMWHEGRCLVTYTDGKPFQMSRLSQCSDLVLDTDVKPPIWKTRDELCKESEKGGI